MGGLSERQSKNWDLGLSFGLGLCPAETEILGAVGTSMLPKLDVGNVDKSAELEADAFWNLGLDLLGFYKDLDSLGPCTFMALTLLACIFLRLFLCFLAKNLGSIPLTDS